jgi:hypothetical protein
MVGSGCGLTEILSVPLPGGTDESTKHLGMRICHSSKKHTKFELSTGLTSGSLIVFIPHSWQFIFHRPYKILPSS